MADLRYKAFTGNSTWWQDDALSIDELFATWITTINQNSSQSSRAVEAIYNPTLGNAALEYSGNLTRFPVGADEFIYWFWAGTSSGMRVTFSEDWVYSVANNGYGNFNSAKNFTTQMGNWLPSGDRAYLIGSSTQDNREFFALGWGTGDGVQYQNAMIMYKDRYGGWAGTFFNNLSGLAMFYSTTNNTYNTPGGANLTLSDPTVLLSMTIPFSANSAQDYVQGQYVSQPANPDVYALGSVSEFGKYVSISANEYITSFGYNAFWIRHGVSDSNIQVYKTYVVTYVVDPVNGDKYFLDGVERPELTIEPGYVYAFDQSDPSNIGNALDIFTEAANTNVDQREALNTGVLKQGDIIYLSISTSSTELTQVWYGSATKGSNPANDPGNTIAVDHAIDTPDPDPTPDSPPPKPVLRPFFRPLTGSIETEVIVWDYSDPVDLSYPNRRFGFSTGTFVSNQDPRNVIFYVAPGETLTWAQDDFSNRNLGDEYILIWEDEAKTQQVTDGRYSFNDFSGNESVSFTPLASDPVGTRYYFTATTTPGLEEDGYIEVVATTTAVLVTVEDSGEGNKFYFDSTSGRDPSQATTGKSFDVLAGTSLTFDQSDASNAGHPLEFYEDAAHTIPASIATTTGTAGTPITSVTVNIPSGDLTDTKYYYKCANHVGMDDGGFINVISA